MSNPPSTSATPTTADTQSTSSPPIVPAPISLRDEKVTFLLSIWGGGLALGFKGDRASVERCYNWAHNTRVTHGRLKWLYHPDAGIGYVFVRSHDDLKNGLIAQFRAEAILKHEVIYIRNEWQLDAEGDEVDVLLEYDEAHLLRLATARAEAFMDDQIVNESFMSGRSTGLAPVYNAYLPDRRWQSTDGDPDA